MPAGEVERHRRCLRTLCSDGQCVELILEINIVKLLSVLKPIRRAVEEKRRALNTNDKQYKVISGRNSRKNTNKKHHRRGYRCKRDFYYAERDGVEGNGFSDHLPKDYSSYPDHVKYGYYMDPTLSKKLAGWAARKLTKNKGAKTLTQRESSCHRNLDEFRSVLRGDRFDPIMAITGASMIIYFNERHPGCVPKELIDFATGLAFAGDKIGVGNDFFYPKNSAFGYVTHSQRCETGDVLVDKSGTGTTFRTKPINTNRMRFSFLKRMLRAKCVTRDKVSATYQSLYHAVAEERKGNEKNPYVVVMNPLYGSVGDGSSKSKDKAAEEALKEAMRFVTLYPNVGVRFQGLSDSASAFRTSLRAKLKEAFPRRDLMRDEKNSDIMPVEDSSDATNEADSGAEGDVLRSLADVKKSPSGRSSTSADHDQSILESGRTEAEGLSGFGNSSDEGSLSDQVFIEYAISMGKKELVEDPEDLNSKTKKPASENGAMVVNVPRSGGNEFNEKRARQVKGERALRSKEIMKPLHPTSEAVFDAQAFIVNGQVPLKLQDIKGQLKSGIDPLRRSYLMESSLRLIPGYQLQEHIDVLAEVINKILAEIANATDAGLIHKNKGKIARIEQVLLKCNAILTGAQGMLNKAASEDQRNKVGDVLHKVVGVLNNQSMSSNERAGAKELVRHRSGGNVFPELVGKEVGLDRPTNRAIEVNVSREAIKVRKEWMGSDSLGKAEVLEGIEGVINISAAARKIAELKELEKKHDQLVGLYLAIKRSKDDDQLVQLQRKAMGVLESMQRSSP